MIPRWTNDQEGKQASTYCYTTESNKVKGFSKFTGGEQVYTIIRKAMRRENRGIEKRLRPANTGNLEEREIGWTVTLRRTSALKQNMIDLGLSIFFIGFETLDFFVYQNSSG